MSDLSIQASFNTGEWAPTLNARVDITKYRSAAALLQNFFVDYRGGASTRPGTQYILQAYKSSTAVRLIKFQAAFSVGYVLEFGDQYLRFYFLGNPVLETGINITAATKANPLVITVPSSGYSIGDWVFISGIVGMTQLNGNYYSILNVSGNNLTLGDLNLNPIDSTTYGTYVSGGTTARVYTIGTPYAAADLALIKYAQNVNQMILCHPSYQPYTLTLQTSTNWTLAPTQFGSTVQAPTNVAVATTLSTGSAHYSYVVTAVDSQGQESVASSPAALDSKQDIRANAGTNNISWNAVSGAQSYNVYESNISFFGVIPAGSQYGFIGNTSALSFNDSNIAADYTQTPPIAENPFIGAGLISVSITAPGTYTTPAPSAIVAASPAGQTATVQVGLGVTVATRIGASGTITVGQLFRADSPLSGMIVQVISVGPPMVQVTTQNYLYLSSPPSSITVRSITGAPGATIGLNLTWGVGIVNIASAGSGYTSAPALTFSSGTASAVGVLAPASSGNPTVPGFFQQRLILAAPVQSPQTFYMSQPGNYFNFNVSNPTLPGDAITGTLVSGQQNTIKSMVPQTSGLLMFTDKYSFLINGGSNGSAISPAATVANAQSFNGVSDVPPIVANFDVLYVQAKGSVIRDSAFNIYQNVFTGTDISVLSSHLFYGFSILEWDYAEEPFKLVQAIRNDGVLLTLTFLKEQEFIGWTHSITQGNFKSVAVVTEQISESQAVDGTYFVVERVVNGNTVKYIERLTERQFPNGVVDACCVDAAILYDGTPQTAFMGAQHLAGLTVTGLADGQPITPFPMPLNGSFTLPTAATKVSIGLGYVCDLQTLALELGEPTVQGKVKSIPNVDVRVADALGLKIGSSFNHLVPMKDLIRGNVSSMLTGQDNQMITDLVTNDARTFLDATYTVPGKYCIRQDLPYPATVLGVIPNVVVGDTGSRR